MQNKPPPQNQDGQLFGRPAAGWRLKIYTVIFEADTRAGRLFDLALVALILASVGVVVPGARRTFGTSAAIRPQRSIFGFAALREHRLFAP